MLHPDTKQFTKEQVKMITTLKRISDNDRSIVMIMESEEDNLVAKSLVAKGYAISVGDGYVYNWKNPDEITPEQFLEFVNRFFIKSTPDMANEITPLTRTIYDMDKKTFLEMIAWMMTPVEDAYQKRYGGHGEHYDLITDTVRNFFRASEKKPLD